MPESPAWGSIIGDSSCTFIQDKREGSMSCENVETVSTWLINSHSSKVPCLVASPRLLTPSDSGIKLNFYRRPLDELPDADH